MSRAQEVTDGESIDSEPEPVSVNAMRRWGWNLNEVETIIETEENQDAFALWFHSGQMVYNYILSEIEQSGWEIHWIDAVPKDGDSQVFVKIRADRGSQ